jgi:CRP-like cAMP-binding protein
MSLETDVKLLAQVPMFSDFSEDKLRLLAFSAETRSFRDGQRLFAAGDRADAGFVVAGGSVALTAPDRRSDAPPVVLGTGVLIGAMSLVVDGKREATATAVGDVSVIMIRRQVFRRMLDEYPDVARRLQDRFAAELQATTAALLQVRQRLDRIGE